MDGDFEELMRKVCSKDIRVSFPAAHAYFATATPLRGAPPAAFIAAITSWPYEAQEALLNVAMAWSRPEMSRALLDALAVAEPDDQADVAWFLKRTLAHEHAAEAIAFARDAARPAAARSWLVEGLEALARGGAIGWRELGSLVEELIVEPAAQLRYRVPGLVAALDWRQESRLILERALRDSEVDVIAAAAHVLATHPEDARQLDHELLAALRRHGNVRVRTAIQRLDEAVSQVD